MRLRNVKNASNIISDSMYSISEPKQYKGRFKDIFNNNNPIHIEIGMGKGNFIIDKAKKNPNINFIGIEKYASVAVRAIQKLEQEQLDNLKIIVIDALELNEVFDHEIDTIYLNFSDPWPKTRHAKRRLTSHIFLKIYDDVFKSTKRIVQKTDNIKLYASSIVSLSTYGYTIVDATLDLHSLDIDNSLTEYEEKFTRIGVKINYLEAIKK